jgi:hypothetical protein
MKRTIEGRSRVFLSVTVVAFAVASATTALAVEVHGTLRVPADYGRTPPVSAEQQGRLRYWDEWNGFIAPREHRFDARRELAVVLTGGPEGSGMFEDQPGFTISNGNLMPSTIVERVGATLRIHNTDPMAHELYAEGLQDFGATPTSPGLVRPQQMPARPGHWTIRDRVYSHVHGTLHVLADLRARATIAADGSYVFRNVQGGTYTLKIFHGEREVHSAEVVVPADRELTVPPIAIGAGRPSAQAPALPPGERSAPRPPSRRGEPAAPVPPPQPERTAPGELHPPHFGGP